MATFENLRAFWEEHAPKSAARLRRLRTARYRCFCGQVLWLTPNSYKDLVVADPTELRYLWYQCPLEDHLYCHENSTFVDRHGREIALLSTWYMRQGPQGALHGCISPEEVETGAPEVQVEIASQEAFERMVGWKKRCDTAISQLRNEERFAQFPMQQVDPIARQEAIEKLQVSILTVLHALITFPTYKG